MNRYKNESVDLDSNLDTLAQSGTSATDQNTFEATHKLVGTGTGKETMKKVPTKKMMDHHILLALIDVAKLNGDFQIWKRYWNAWHCFEAIKTNGERTFGSYCKTRFCSICNANRKAMLVRRYKPIIEQWQEPYFLTLTRQSVKKAFLLSTIKDNNLKFSSIINRLKKRNQRGNGPEIVALKFTECNYNPKEGRYNPHYHIITENKEIGELILKGWLKEQNKNQTHKIALPTAQHLIKIKDRNKNLIKAIKYGVKVVTDPDIIKGGNRNKLPIIYAAAMHEIHKAFSGKRLISKYGFTLPKEEKKAIVNYADDSDVKSWSYDAKLFNYIDTSTAEVMYSNNDIPSSEMEYIAKERIDRNKN